MVGTIDNFPLRDNLKALQAAKQQCAMTNNNKCYESGVEGGGYLNGPTPCPFIYHFGRKGTPFIYFLLKKSTPFTYLI